MTIATSTVSLLGMTEEAYRYEELAHFITTLVDVGTLMPGARAPSLRSISRERKVSMATAMQAYRLLDASRLDRHLARTAREHGSDYNIYTGPQGDPKLRREIARRALRWGRALS